MRKPTPTAVTAPAPPPSTAAEVPVPLTPARRRPIWIVTGILLVALGAVAVAWVVTLVRVTTVVVIATKTIPQGTTITSDMLGTATISPDPALHSVAASQLPNLIGTKATVTIPTGALVTPESTAAHLTPQEGRILVGIALTAAQAPTGLVPGAQVRIVSTPRTGDEAPTGPPAVDVTAIVVSTTAHSGTDTAALVVDVDVAAADAAKVAGLAATGRIALIVIGQ